MAAVKICGVNSPAAFDAAAAAAFVGFNFFPPSPRFVTPAEAAALAARSAGGPHCVGLFVEPTEDAIAAVLAQLRLDALQIYASPERASQLRRVFGLPVWLAIGVDGTTDLPRVAEGVDRLVVDAQAPPDAVLPGGNAAPFDWSLLRGWTAPVPWLLAGGLTPDNVAAAIRSTGATAVDVSSGVETTRGVKDPALIGAFLAAARAA